MGRSKVGFKTFNNRIAAKGCLVVPEGGPQPYNGQSPARGPLTIERQQMADYKAHGREAIEASGQYLHCVAASREIGWDRRRMIDSPPDHLRIHETAISRHIADAVRAVDRENAHVGVLSTQGQCAVAQVSDRPDLTEKAYGTLLECTVRAGPRWFPASSFVQANRWTKPLGHA